MFHLRSRIAGGGYAALMESKGLGESCLPVYVSIAPHSDGKCWIESGWLKDIPSPGRSEHRPSVWRGGSGSDNRPFVRQQQSAVALMSLR